MNTLYGKRLKLARNSLERNNTQATISESLGIDVKHFSKLETGKRKPSIPLHINICLKLEKSSEFFLKDENNAMILTETQLNYLKSMNNEKLKTILNVIKYIYEENS